MGASESSLANVGIIANPWSGRGAGVALSESLASFLCAQGFSVSQRPSATRYVESEIDSFFAAADAVVAIGGDGTVGKLLPIASRNRRPLYMLPAGNESLFARAFSMTPDFASIAATLRRGRVVMRHFAFAGETPFFLMASVGFDAFVVEALSRVRRGPVGTVGYVLPSCRVFCSYSAPRVTVSVDGEQVISDEPGYFIVANSAEYARRLDPVPEASSESPLLKARFFPNFSRLSVMQAAIDVALKRPLRLPSKSFEGRCFEVSARQGAALQADGEYVGSTPVVIRRAEALVPVLLP